MSGDSAEGATYLCWGEHEDPDGKDLTERVEEAKALAGNEETRVFYARLPRGGQRSAPSPRHVLVKCGEDHENVFRIDRDATSTTGREPTAEEKIAFAAAANLVPEKSLARTQELAKFVFSSIGVIGTLLTGLGLFTDLGDVLDSTLKVEGIPLALLFVGLSLTFAALALLPEMKRVDLSRLDQVESWYRRQIKWRGRAVQLSLALFTLAIVAAAAAGFDSDAASPDKPSITGGWTGLGKEAVVKVAAKTADVPEDWLMVTTVYAHKDAAAEKRVFYDLTRPNSDGEVAVAAEVQVVEGVKRVKATVRLYPGDVDDEPEAESDLVLARG